MKWQPIPVFLPGEPHGQRSLTESQSVGNDWSDWARMQRSREGSEKSSACCASSLPLGPHDLVHPIHWALTSGHSQLSLQFSLVAQSCSTLRPHEPQHTRPPYPSPTAGVHPNPCPLSWWCHPTISSSVIPSPPAFNLSRHQGLLKLDSSSHQVAKVLELQLQPHSFQWTPRTDIL